MRGENLDRLTTNGIAFINHAALTGTSPHPENLTRKRKDSSPSLKLLFRPLERQLHCVGKTNQEPSIHRTLLEPLPRLP